MATSLNSIARAIAGLAALMLGGVCSAVAQEFPTKPIRLIVGPGPDVVARAVGQKLTEAWGQAIVVEQLPGAGGVIAAQTVAKSPADGYTLLLTTGSYSIMQAIQPKVQFSLLKDFTPVAQIASLGFVLLANPSLPVTNLSELIGFAVAKPGFVNCASTGPGTTAHLGCEMLRTYAKADVVHVPYNGPGPALIDLMAGRVHIFFSPGTDFSNVKTGRLKALAVTGAERVAAIPEVPTITQAGWPQLAFSSWNGVHAPAGTPTTVIAKLAAQILKATITAEVADKLALQGFVADPKPADAFGKFVEADVARWKTIVAETGAQPD